MCLTIKYVAFLLIRVFIAYVCVTCQTLQKLFNEQSNVLST